MASAAARLLFACGVPVVLLERAAPLAVRRLVCFADAVWTGEARVEGVVARRVESREEAEAALARPGFIPLLVDPEGRELAALRPRALVDGRMAKASLDTRREPGRVTVGLGPGFCAGRDVDAVVETQRGAELGRVIWAGTAIADTALPAPVEGIDRERVLRAPGAGAFRGRARIGAVVAAGERLGEVAGAPVLAPIAGLVRGLIADGVEIEAGVKIGDLDPRGDRVDPARVSDKGRAVASGVLEAVLAGFCRSVG